MLAFSLCLYSASSFSAEVQKADCCPYGNNCGGQVNCPGSGWNKKAEKREFVSKKSKPRNVRGTDVQGE
jgi:hypothetical protein